MSGHDWKSNQIKFAARRWAEGATMGDITDGLAKEFGLVVTRCSLSGLIHRNRDLFAHRQKPSSKKTVRRHRVTNVVRPEQAVEAEVKPWAGIAKRTILVTCIGNKTEGHIGKAPVSVAAFSWDLAA